MQSKRSSILEGLHTPTKRVVKIDEVKTDDILGMARFVSHAVSNRHGLSNVSLELAETDGVIFSIVVCFESPMAVTGAMEEALVSDLHCEIVGNFIIPMTNHLGTTFKITLDNVKISEDLYKVRVIISNKTPITSDIPSL